MKIPKWALAPEKEPVPKEVERYIKELLRKGYGVCLYRDRKGKLFHASVTRTGKVEEVGCN